MSNKNCYVLKNGNVFMKPEDEGDYAFVKADVYIENGKIKEISSDLELTCESIDMSDRYILPGLIESHSRAGLVEHGIGVEGKDDSEVDAPIKSKLYAIDGINVLDPSFLDMKMTGITTVGIFPANDNVISGFGCVLKNKNGVVDEMIMTKACGLKGALGVSPKVARGGKTPVTRMGSMALLNQFILDNQYEPVNEDVKAVIEGERPLYIECERHDDIETALRLKERFELDVRLIGLSDYSDVKRALYEKKISFSIGPIMGYAHNFETVGRDVYRVLDKSDLNDMSTLCTNHPLINCKYTMLQGTILSQNGLDDISVLKMMTINAAKFLDIDERVGSIQVGKDADFSVWDVYPLEPTANVVMTMVDGEIVYKEARDATY